VLWLYGMIISEIGWLLRKGKKINIGLCMVIIQISDERQTVACYIRKNLEHVMARGQRQLLSKRIGREGEGEKFVQRK